MTNVEPDALSQWFEVDLDTLRIHPTDLASWPAEMSSPNSRMLEECLESVVALNLDVLFPREALQLVSTQFSLVSAADITAIDPIGCLRLIEVKAQKTKHSELHAQALTYAMKELNVSERAWQGDLGVAIGVAPDWVSLAREGVLLNTRFKDVGGSYVGLAKSEWARHERYDQRRRIAAAARATRGAPPEPFGLDDPFVRASIERVFGITTDALLAGPATARDACLCARIGRAERTSAEVTVIAPDTSNLVADSKALEKRSGVHFHFVDAELRRTKQGQTTRRALLSWRSAYRTVKTEARRTITAFYKALRAIDEEAARFTWQPIYPDNPEWSRLYWSAWPTYQIRYREHLRELITASEAMTQGTCVREPARRAAIASLMARAVPGVTPLREARGKTKSETWRTVDDDAAARLVAAYYQIGEQHHARDVLRYFERSEARAPRVDEPDITVKSGIEKGTV